MYSPSVLKVGWNTVKNIYILIFSALPLLTYCQNCATQNESVSITVREQKKLTSGTNWQFKNIFFIVEVSNVAMVGWTSDAYDKQNWKHFRGSEVVLWLVGFYRISEKCLLSFSLTLCLETKMLWCQNPLMEEEIRHVYDGDNESLSGSTKHWILKSMWNM